MQIKDNFWPLLTWHRAINAEALQHVRRNNNPMDNQWESCRLHRDHLPSPFLPGKGAVCQCGEGTGWDHARAARTWTLKLEEGLFYYIIKVFGSNVRLNCIDGTFVFIHLASWLQRKNSRFIFPLLTHLKKKKKKKATVFRKPTFGVLPVKIFSKLSPD